MGERIDYEKIGLKDTLVKSRDVGKVFEIYTYHVDSKSRWLFELYGIGTLASIDNESDRYFFDKYFFIHDKDLNEYIDQKKFSGKLKYTFDGKITFTQGKPYFFIERHLKQVNPKLKEDLQRVFTQKNGGKKRVPDPSNKKRRGRTYRNKSGKKARQTKRR